MSLPVWTLLLLGITRLHAAEDSTLTALRAADDERVRATLAADRAGLNRIYSDELRYAHSTGVVDTKAGLVETITSGRTNYEAFRYEERSFEVLAPGVAIMTGRARARVITAGGPGEATLNFLAVWREEKGKWRFRAWQSCKIPVPAKVPR